MADDGDLDEFDTDDDFDDEFDDDDTVGGELADDEMPTELDSDELMAEVERFLRDQGPDGA